MGCFAPSRQENIATIKKLSNNQIDERIIEEIIMNTYFEESELVKLYKIFRSLNPGTDGKINAMDFMEMPNIKYCAFKKYLVKAFNLEEKDVKEEVNFDKLAMIQEYEAEEEERDIQNNMNKYESNNYSMSSSNSKSPNSNKADKMTMNNYIDRNEEDRLKNNKKNKSNKNIPKSKNNTDNKYNQLKNNMKLHPKLNLNLRSNNNNNPNNPLRKRHRTIVNHKNEKIDIGEHFLDFKKFCNYMKIFNIKYPVDLKIKFYFKIFDVDGDGLISRKDLRDFIEEVIPKNDLEEDDEKSDLNVSIKNENPILELKEVNIQQEIDRELHNINNKIKSGDNGSSNKNDKDKTKKINADEIIDILFTEVLGSVKRTNIELDEFSKLMWLTTIDSSCIIYFN